MKFTYAESWQQISNLTEAFIQMGVDGLSVVPACVLPVRKAIRSILADEANRPEEAVSEIREIISGKIKILRISMLISSHIGSSGFFDE